MSRRRTRINFGWLIVSALLLFICSFLVFFRLLESTVGGPVSSQVQSVPNDSRSLKIAILRSEYTARSYDELDLDGTGAAYRDSLVVTWRHTLEKHVDAPLQAVGDRDIEQGFLLDDDKIPVYDLLILPSARALSEIEIEQIQSFLRSGGSVWGAWALGLYAPTGEWRSWSFLEETFGVSFVEEVEHQPAEYNVAWIDTLQTALKPGFYVAKSEKGDDTQLPSEEFSLDEFTWVGDNARPRRSYAELKPLNGTDRLITFFEWTGRYQTVHSPVPTGTSVAKHLTFRGGSPLTVGIPAGYRLRVGSYDHPIKVKTISDRTRSAAYWYDYIFEDELVPDALEAGLGLVYGNYGKGRFIYSGFDLNALRTAESKSLGLVSEDQIVLERLVSNSLAWLGRRPVSWLSQWPYGFDAAAVMAGIVDTEIDALKETSEMLQGAGVPGTFFIRPDAARERDRPILLDIQQHGELALLNDPFRSATGSSGNGPADGKRLIDRLLGDSGTVAGYFTTTMGGVDSIAAAALKSSGFRYFLSDSVSGTSVPTYLSDNQGQLIRINKSGRNSQEVLLRGVQDASGFQATLAPDVERIRYERGLLPVVFYVSDLARPEFAAGLGGVARLLVGKNFWTTTASQAAAWTGTRRHIASSTRKYSPERTVVHISNDNGSAVDSIGVYVYLDQPFDPARQTIRIRSEDAWEYLRRGTISMEEGQDFKLLEYDGESFALLLLKVTRLKPNEYRTYQIDITPRNLSTRRTFFDRLRRAE